MTNSKGEGRKGKRIDEVRMKCERLKTGMGWGMVLRKKVRK
jgi:hypothetical protein